MISENEFMKRNGVSKKEYVRQWIEEGLIPGVIKDESTGELLFPESARRPYRPRCKSTAKAPTIMTSIVKACIKRQHVSARTYSMSPSEFQNMVQQLEIAGLIKSRIDNGITYYDATIESEEYANRKFHVLQQYVLKCISSVAEAAVKGATEAALVCVA